MVRTLASFMPVIAMATATAPTARFAWLSRRSLKTRFRAEAPPRFSSWARGEARHSALTPPLRVTHSMLVLPYSHWWHTVTQHWCASNSSFRRLQPPCVNLKCGIIRVVLGLQLFPNKIRSGVLMICHRGGRLRTPTWTITGGSRRILGLLEIIWVV